MIRWLDEEEEDTQLYLGQTTPATEGTVREKLSTVEKILLASVIISATGLVVHLWELFGRGRVTRIGADDDL